MGEYYGEDDDLEWEDPGCRNDPEWEGSVTFGEDDLGSRWRNIPAVAPEIRIESSPSLPSSYTSSRWPRLDRKIYRDLAKLEIDPKQIALAGKGTIRDLFNKTAVYERILRIPYHGFSYCLNEDSALVVGSIEVLFVSGIGTYLLGREGNFELFILYGKKHSDKIRGDHLCLYTEKDSPLQPKHIHSFVDHQLSKLEEYLRNGRGVRDECLATYRETKWNS